jgi:DNA-binding response OmpR family regulator
LVDDEQDLVWAVWHSLSDEGYEVLTAYDGVEAMAAVHKHRPDLIVLDIVMPRLDGLQVCHKLRREPNLAAIPILFLTVRSTIEDRLTGFAEGSDDYLVKPFDLRELKAHIRALLRRTRSAPEGEGESDERPSLLMVGSLTLDGRNFQAHIGEKTANLTTTEFELIHHLVLHPGEVFSSQQLLQQVWGYPLGTADPSLVRWHIKNLRAKIEPDPDNPIYIQSLHRHGYMFERRHPDN